MLLKNVKNLKLQLNKIPGQHYIRVITNKDYSTNVISNQNIAYKSILPYDNIPGPSSLPLIGTLHHFFPGGKLSNLNMEELQTKLHEDYGDIVILKGFPGKEDMVSLLNLDDIEKVYRTETIWPERPGLEVRDYYLRNKRPDVFKSVYGLLHSHGEEWQKIRTKINPPMMQIKVIRQYVGWIEEIANDFIFRLSTLLDSNGNVPENFQTEINRWSLESIGRVAIDTRLGCLDPNLDENSDGMKLIRSLQRFFDLAYQVEVQPSIWKHISTPKFNEIMELFDCFTEIAIKYIKKAIERLESNPTADEDNLSVLEKLLKIDEQVAIIMALDMFFAAVDTTGSATLNTLFLLAKNPDKQNILRKELLSIFPKRSAITADGLNKLSYLKACFKEAHRMKPVFLGNFRLAGDDIVLSGYKVPKGTYLILNHYLAAKMKNQFPEADKYLPERWLRTGPDGKAPAKCAHKFAYMPFGFGPRMCAGKRFAELEMEILVTKLITNYNLEWNGPDMMYKSSLIMAPTGPMRFKLTPTN